jgi:3-phenylpropionate/cinnamic acid dioxygenase small subunit
MSAPSDQDLARLVAREARLIDEQRFAEWLDLFAEDATYWIPLHAGQTDPRLEASLIFEDKTLLRIRVKRLTDRNTISQQPRSRCHHLLQLSEVEHRDAAGGSFTTWTPAHYVETRADSQQLYAVWITHTFALVDGDLKIHAKRIDLVNPDAAFDSIELFM